MEHVIATKSILKKPLLASTPETSWLSRIQSRLSYTEDTSFELKRQALQRVTFSMGQLTTEHLLAYDDTLDDDECDDDEDSNPPPPPPPPRISSFSPLSLTTMSDYTLSLPYCYERSCRLREEKEWPVFMDLLQAHW
jgi:hypothetical protein